MEAVQALTCGVANARAEHERLRLDAQEIVRSLDERISWNAAQVSMNRERGAVSTVGSCGIQPLMAIPSLQGGATTEVRQTALLN